MRVLFFWSISLVSALFGSPCLTDPPQGPDGFVYDSKASNLRFATLRPGHWTFSPTFYQPCKLSPAEAAATRDVIERVKAVILETPTAAQPIGFFGDFDSVVLCDGSKPGASTLNSGPLQYDVGFAEEALFEVKDEKGNWCLNQALEGGGFDVIVNRVAAPGEGFAVGYPSGKIHQGKPTTILTRIQPQGTFHGVSFYGPPDIRDTNSPPWIMITRPGRDVLRPATVGEVMATLLNPPGVRASDLQWKEAHDQAAERFQLMTAAERSEPACVAAEGPPPGPGPGDRTRRPRIMPRGGGMDAGAFTRIRPVGGAQCTPLYIFDPDTYFDRALPRTAIQSILLDFRAGGGTCLMRKDGQILPKDWVMTTPAGFCWPEVKILNDGCRLHPSC